MEPLQTYRPKRGVFESTLACNLHCRHCGSSAGTARDDELSTSECHSLFEQLRGIGMEWITISGGEPTTRPDWNEKILRSPHGEHCWNGCGAGKTNIGIECNGNIADEPVSTDTSTQNDTSDDTGGEDDDC